MNSSTGLGRDGAYLFENVPAGTITLELIAHDGDVEYTVYQATVDIPDGATVVHDIALGE